MNAEKQVKDAKVVALNQTLTSVENELMGRAMDRWDADLDKTLDCINQGAEAGVIDIQCGEGGEAAEPAGDEPVESGEEPVEDGTDE